MVHLIISCGDSWSFNLSVLLTTLARLFCPDARCQPRRCSGKTKAWKTQPPTWWVAGLVLCANRHEAQKLIAWGELMGSPSPHLCVNYAVSVVAVPLLARRVPQSWAVGSEPWVTNACFALSLVHASVTQQTLSANCVRVTRTHVGLRRWANMGELPVFLELRA